jgi:hypothetical protein
MKFGGSIADFAKQMLAAATGTWKGRMMLIV